MMPSCDVCGRDARKASTDRGEFFCTQTCFDSVKKTSHCVPFYESYEVFDQNRAFRKILYTDDKVQVVSMYLKPNEKIGDERDANKPEVHPNATQIMRLERGIVTLTLYNDDMEPRPREMDYNDEDMVIIPSGKYHLIENTGASHAILNIIYSPPVH